MDFHERFRNARPRRITQQEAADHIGVSDSAISTWERGQRWPDINDFARLVELYGMKDADVLELVRAAGRSTSATTEPA